MSGNSAYALIEWTGFKAKTLQLFKEPKHKDSLSCADFLKDVLTQHTIDAIAIDAPFSLPKALVDPNFRPSLREANGEIVNPYLFRYCDYWLYSTYGLRPMPPAGDRIGRLTARMIELFHFFDYQMPYLHLPQGKTPLYEVYPKQIAQALGYEKYKDKTNLILESFQFNTPVDEHLLDAILCSFCASQVLEGKTIHPPLESIDEGWCYPLSL